MDLRKEERLMKVYHHHPTPFVFKMVKTIIGFLPFFFLLYMAKDSFSMKGFVIAHLVLFALFAIVCAYTSIIYWSDTLVVTNERIIYINWTGLATRKESEAFLSDIEEIQTQEKGFISKFWIFDYGRFRLETAASSVSIDYNEAPDPEGIRKFIYHIKPQ
ncbi:PH domain-containing protein [Candidatus Gracilibacteria bacterium]|jgi:uncharacterized membrane protein YdbT with pleckstrin-like domain|nr:PH domain-containing protein [Candidatus Gracilibacteria bacterium]